MKTQNKTWLFLFFLLLANCTFAQDPQTTSFWDQDWLYYLYFDAAFGLIIWGCVLLLRLVGNGSSVKRRKKISAH